MIKYELEFDDQFILDVKRHKRSGNKTLVKKIELLINELYEHPRYGTGKPEQLKGQKDETWSRRVDSKHRLIYKIFESELIVVAISASGHYGDK